MFFFYLSIFIIVMSWLSIATIDSKSSISKTFFIIGHPMFFYGTMCLEKHSAQIRGTGLVKTYLKQLEDAIYTGGSMQKNNFEIFNHLSENNIFYLLLVVVLFLFVSMLFIVFSFRNKYIYLSFPIVSLFLLLAICSFFNKYEDYIFNKEISPIVEKIQYSMSSDLYNDNNREILKDIISKAILQLSEPYKSNESLQKRMTKISEELYLRSQTVDNLEGGMDQNSI